MLSDISRQLLPVAPTSLPDGGKLLVVCLHHDQAPCRVVNWAVVAGVLQDVFTGYVAMLLQAGAAQQRTGREIQ